MRRAWLALGLSSFVACGIVAACGIDVTGSLVQPQPPPKPEASLPEASLPPGLDGSPDDATADVFGAPLDPSNVDAGLLSPDASALAALTAIDTELLTITLEDGGVLTGVSLPPGVTFTHVYDGDAGKLAVLSGGDIALGPGALQITGTPALVVLSSGELVVSGSVLAAGVGVVPGPGGFLPGEGPGAGSRGTRASNDDTGGGGAGHATPGAPASKTTDNASVEADGGVAYDRPLVGGSGGGEGASSAPLLDCGRGGAGGGAVQLYARRILRVTASGIVNVGGAGGLAGCSNGAGGGGGAGGTVWLEGPRVEIGGVLAANGGGGGGASRGGGEPGQPGEGGRASAERADGGLGGKVSAEAKSGGAGGALAGPPVRSDTGATENSGGGGGAVGRVRVRAREILVDGGVVSPALEKRAP